MRSSKTATISAVDPQDNQTVTADSPVRSTVRSFAAIVDRVEAVVDAETDALKNHRPVDMAGLILRKRQGLLELSRIMRAFSGLGPQVEAQNRLDRLSVKLEGNRVVLDRRLRAVREVADIISTAMKDADSDGTYTKMAGRS